jgi:enoyl-CoA hydratase
MNYKTLRFEEPEAGIGVITLDRPDRLNAINTNMLEELYALFAELRKNDSVRVLLLEGAGKGFCSGADLKDDRLSGEEGLKLFASAAIHLDKIQKTYSGIIEVMHKQPQPIIAVVNGAAAGGGMCLALASDIIIAGPKAKFIPSFINIGLSGGELGTTYFLPRCVGRAKASEILMTGRAVAAEEADRIGLVSRLVPEDTLMETAMETARTMLAKSQLGLRLTKETLRQNENAPCLETAIELENRNQSILCCSPDFFNAVMAFLKV